MDQSELRRLTANWAVPPELMRSTPRGVALAGMGKGMRIAAVLVFVVCGLVSLALVAVALSEADDARRLGVEGKETEGKIVRIWDHTGKSTDHIVAYTCGVGGHEYRVDQQVD